MPHFNEVDQGSRSMRSSPTACEAWGLTRLTPFTTCDGVRSMWRIRLGLQISGSVPRATSRMATPTRRLAPIVFPAGGATINGVSKPGDRVVTCLHEDDVLNVDIGRGSSVRLPGGIAAAQNATNPEWPVMHAVLHGESRSVHGAEQGQPCPGGLRTRRRDC